LTETLTVKEVMTETVSMMMGTEAQKIARKREMKVAKKKNGNMGMKTTSTRRKQISSAYEVRSSLLVEKLSLGRVVAVVACAGVATKQEMIGKKRTMEEGGMEIPAMARRI
jgi:phage-related protein